MNNVNLLGTLVGDPTLSVDRSGQHVCVMHLAVPRRQTNGQLEPGVVYVDVAIFGGQARVFANHLTAGDRVGVSGSLEREDALEVGPRRSRWEVHAHQVDIVDAVTPAVADYSRLPTGT